MVKALDTLLSETLTQLKNYVYLETTSDDKKKQGDESSVKVIEDGGNNSVHLQRHPVSLQYYDPATFTPLGEIKKDIRIAVSKSRTPDEQEDQTDFQKFIYKKKRTEEEDQSKKMLRLLSALENTQEPPYHHQSSTQFIQHFLYCGKGRKVTFAADSDLYEWSIKNINDNNFTEEKLKKIIAQILMSVDALHSGELAHRDIKPENFLFHSILRGYIELADLDTIMSIRDPHPTRPTFTPAYLAPECRSEKNKQLPEDDADLTMSLYQRVAKKPIDCYAIGYMLEAINSCITSSSISKGHKTLLSTLTLGLRNPNPAYRLTITAAMDHRYFGPTKTARIDYFNDVRKEYQLPDIFIGGYYYDRKKHFYGELGNAFYLLPDPVKDLYFQAASLQTQIKLICEGYSLNDSHFNAINKQIGIIKDSLQKMPEFDESHTELKSILDTIKDHVEKAEELVKAEQQHFHITIEPITKRQRR